MPEPPEPAAAPPARSAYRRWLGSVGSWFGFWGAQSVVFQWLVVDWLQESPARVGTAQMTLSLPPLLFLLVGGAVADRLDPRRLLLGLQGAAVLVVAALLGVLGTGRLGYPLLLGFGLAVGLLQALSLPARDALLSSVVTGDLSRSVAGATITQHASQALGALLAGSASWIGGPAVLGLQMATLTLGLPAIAGLPAAPPRPSTPLRVADLRAGLHEVVTSAALRPAFLFAATAGVFFVGPYLVVLPLMVRDVYGGGAAEMGVLTSMFPLGSLVGGVAILARGGLRAKGRALFAGHLLAAACVASLAFGLPFAGTAGVVFAWGLCGSLFLNAGRTLFQEHASEAQRARVLSVYALGVMGGATFGTQLSGLLVGMLGLQGAVLGAAGFAALLGLGIAATSRLLQVP